MLRNHVAETASPVFLSPQSSVPISDWSVCAVVVTFHARETVLENLKKVHAQVQGLVVVDNGSPVDSLRPLRELAHTLGFVLIENQWNAGVAAALNSGARWAKEHGFSHVLLFDQDSTVTEGFAAAMLNAYRSHPHRDRVALVTCSQLETTCGLIRKHRSARDGSPLIAITSGSLMPLSVFDVCGWFQEELIIDCVDHEYCLRARALGFTLAECREALLMVTVGATNQHQAFGMTINARHYSAPRRYYLTRNRLVMILRFWRQEPAWCLRMLRDIAQDAVKVLLVEKEAWSKTRITARGICDALSGRMGKVVEL